jgi:hypothetical protein
MSASTLSPHIPELLHAALFRGRAHLLVAIAAMTLYAGTLLIAADSIKNGDAQSLSGGRSSPSTVEGRVVKKGEDYWIKVAAGQLMKYTWIGTRKQTKWLKATPSKRPSLMNGMPPGCSAVRSNVLCSQASSSLLLPSACPLSYSRLD